MHVIPRLIDNWLETKASWDRARAHAHSRIYCTDRRALFAVIAFEFFISLAIVDSLTFSSGPARWNSASVPTLSRLRFSRARIADVAHTLPVDTCVPLARARAPLDLSVSSGFKSREIYPFPLLFPYWNSSVQPRNPFPFSIHRCCCCCCRRRRCCFSFPSRGSTRYFYFLSAKLIL